jgi:branched-chain amino acid transport system permease protein
MTKTMAARGGAAVSFAPVVRRVAPWLGLAALFLALPKIFSSGSSLTMLSLMGIMIVFALSYNMLLGETGLLSFGHAVYYGLGGFLAAHAMNTVIRDAVPVPVVLIPLIGGISGLLFGFIFGSVSTRRGGTAFAMISLGLGELVASSSLILRGVFGGEEGISTNRTKLLRLFGLTFGPQLQVYYLIAAWCLLCMIAMYALTRTPFGRACNAVRDNPERAQFIGYNPRTVRYLVFCLSGFFAGVAGGLAAINFELVNSAAVGAQQSGTVLLAAYIGGIGSFIGPVIGAVLVAYLGTMLSDLTDVWQLYFGLMFIAVVMFAPNGLAGLLVMHEPLWQARAYGPMLWLVVTYMLALPAALLLVIGLSLAIEMTFHLTVRGSEGSMMTFFHVPIDAATMWPWLGTAVLVLGGFWLFRRTWPIINTAWHRGLLVARHEGSSG